MSAAEEDRVAAIVREVREANPLPADADGLDPATRRYTEWAAEREGMTVQEYLVGARADQQASAEADAYAEEIATWARELRR